VQEKRHAVPASRRWKTAVQVKDEDELPMKADEMPTIADDEGLTMESGARAGLQSAAEVKAAIDRKRARELEEYKRMQASGKELETTYRDATGRRLDPMLRRAELRYQQEKREQEEQEEKIAEEKRQRELRAGLAQQREQEEKRTLLQKQGTEAFANTREDVQYNEMLKAQDRWNDPAAGFLSKETKEKKRRGRRVYRNVPLYEGVAPPNRFGIRPGYRWDGVDRSNGFEKLWFQKQNEKRVMQEERDRWEAAADD
jgi:pre-mRNA-splicing factor CWC26